MTSLSNDFMTSDVDTCSRSGDVLAKIQGFISLQLLKSSVTKHWVFGCFCIWVYSLLPQINGRTPKRDRLDRDRKQLYVGCTNGLPEGDTVTQLLTHTHTVSTLFWFPRWLSDLSQCLLAWAKSHWRPQYRHLCIHVDGLCLPAARLACFWATGHLQGLWRGEECVTVSDV